MNSAPRDGDRVPLVILARLFSWQGSPPAMMSTRHASIDSGGKVRTSSHRRTLGQCLASTFLRNSLISTCQAQCNPALSNPRSIPPHAANKLPKVSGLGTWRFLLLARTAYVRLVLDLVVLRAALRAAFGVRREPHAPPFADLALCVLFGRHRISPDSLTTCRRRFPPLSPSPARRCRP
jgi:hypothetical protein